MTHVERAVAALRKGGVVVKEYGNWRNLSGGVSFNPRGIIFHHDASQFGPSPSVRDWMWVNGDLVPACHFWVDMEGTWWVGSNGRANHAGRGGGWGVIRADSGNEDAFGVEVDHTVGEPWPPKQYNSIVKGFALIDREFGFNPHNANCGHKEYAPDRKIDPDGVDLNRFRNQVSAFQPGDEALSPEDKTWLQNTVRAEIVRDIRQRDLRLAQIEKRLDASLDRLEAKAAVLESKAVALDVKLESKTSALDTHVSSVAQDLGARIDTLAADLKPTPGA